MSELKEKYILLDTALSMFFTTDSTSLDPSQESNRVSISGRGVVPSSSQNLCFFQIGTRLGSGTEEDFSEKAEAIRVALLDEYNALVDTMRKKLFPNSPNVDPNSDYSTGIRHGRRTNTIQERLVHECDLRFPNILDEIIEYFDMPNSGVGPRRVVKMANELKDLIKNLEKIAEEERNKNDVQTEY